MSKKELIADEVGIMTTAYLLMAIAIKKDKEDMHEIAMGISGINPKILVKYWEYAQTVRQFVQKCLDENTTS